MAKRIEERDLWWEAREKTRKMYDLQNVFNPVKTKMMSFAGGPVRPVMAALMLGRDRGKVTLSIDFNKYREPQVKRIKEYQDAGVDLFIGRMGGPGAWVYDQWNYTEDKTWRMMLEECAKIGIEPKDTVGYGVQNPFLGEEANFNDHYFADYLDKWGQGGADPGAYVADHEINMCWKGGKENYCTTNNMIRSLANDTEQVWQKFKKITVIYSGMWFINKIGRGHYDIYFSNINNGAMRRPTWLAWVPQDFSKKQFTNLEMVLDELLVPTEAQKDSFLRVGNTTALLWQFSFVLKLPGDATGVDASVSLLPKEDVLKALNMAPGEVEPEEPEEPKPPVGDVELRLSALEDWAAGIQLNPYQKGGTSS